MQPNPTDRLARSIHRAATRRDLLGRLAPAGAALLAVVGRPARPAAAKKKKGCKFTKTATVWTLKKDCKISKTLVIPAGVTLDGASHTISGKGNTSKFKEGMIENGGGHVGVRDLTIDGSALACNANNPLHGIFFDQATATIERTSFVGCCGFGVEPSSDSVGMLLEIVDCAVDASRSVKGGLVIRTGSVTNTNVTGGPIGIVVANGEATVTGCNVSGAAVGVHVSDAVGHLTHNTIAGRGQGTDQPSGIWFEASGGNADDNTVSNFFDGGSTAGCGIRISADSGSVVYNGNAFPNPPGNEVDICDER